ncbi:NAD(P)-dependent oxidoreductase [Kribbella deserti]|uniref:NAD(P)-dependent oxidoreductase n=1 Tax=Kribbella deserti TaxID=1926257 RepID=A0ABV6QXK1_9ACTN
MARLVVLGYTGYAGGRITAEALRRGHEVIGVSRSSQITPEDLKTPDHPAPTPDRLITRSGSVHDPAFLADVSTGADVLVIAIPARPIDGQQLVDAMPTLTQVARDNNLRLAVAGGAGSLLTKPDGPRLVDTPEFPATAKPEATSHAQVLEAFRALPEDVDWFYVSPGASFGSNTPGERRGRFRIGGDILLTDDEGNSFISGDDYATAFLDEIERPEHHRTRFTIAY